MSTDTAMVVYAQNLRVGEWSPKDSPPTEVHVLFEIPQIVKHPIAIRFGNAQSLANFIEALIEHGNDIWNKKDENPPQESANP